ncbi:uncharacterized protein LOC113240301 isoform X2 [Hyposmocoma kahamanoa]|uniref:uncharacterized protein LOC113240301 isoform X2 n=1 Tax=Hyposmocoma kahamanoa TaxID=1477025 RepID=UPI000E6D7A40|nr:uncharacterized protein LOC113240301 isoform X2 [Hyposmocoma kahamanoa]
MHTLIALLLAAAAACTIARPPGFNDDRVPRDRRYRDGLYPVKELKENAQRFMLRLLTAPYKYGYRGDFTRDLMNGEIDNMYDENMLELVKGYFLKWVGPDPPPEKPLSLRDIIIDDNINKYYMYNPEIQNSARPLNLDSHASGFRYFPQSEPMSGGPDFLDSEITTLQQTLRDSKAQSVKHEEDNGTKYTDKNWKKFALTPEDKEFFESAEDKTDHDSKSSGMSMIPVMHHEGTAPKVPSLIFEPPRQTRQNPTLSKQKHLVEPDIGKLKAGLSHEDGDVTIRPLVIQVGDSNMDPADSLYGVALVAAVGAALSMAILGFAFGWYTLSKKAKAAADVDYPAYGVTGPTIDTSGDRKLAHSAHMYHYQHQKQQIIAMERNGLEQRTGSVSDPESEEENEEGDYTVYECPGFATTGDMEVKNPLFSEDPTPATPGQCEVVKPQPKN